MGAVENSEEDEGFDPRWRGAALTDNTWHFHRQLYQRYRGLVLAPGDYTDLVEALTDGRAVLVKHRGASAAPIHGVRVKSCGKLVFIVANKRTIHTAYPSGRFLYETYKALTRKKLPEPVTDNDPVSA